MLNNVVSHILDINARSAQPVSLVIQSNNPESLFADCDVIDGYSRAQAIEDGVLADLSKACPDICIQFFKLHVACTAAVWNLIEAAIAQPQYDLNGTVHDILHMAVMTGHANSSKKDVDGYRFPGLPCNRKTNRITFQVFICETLHELKMVCGPGDQAEPVLTVMLPNED